MRNQIKKVFTLLLVFTMVMSMFVPYSLTSATQATQGDIPDALITGFRYSVDGADKVVTTFAELDVNADGVSNPDGTYSAYIDIDLSAGAKSVTISDIVEAIAEGEEGYELTVTPSDYVVDVSGGKGIVEFDARYTKDGVEKRNYYIVRFMVTAPTITDYDTPIASGKYKFVNKPFDYFTQYPFIDRAPAVSHDINAWMLSYVGDEIYNSYLLFQSTKDAKGVNDEDTLKANAPTKPYMYKFTAPADGKLIIVASKAATSDAWTSDFKLVSGNTSLPYSSSLKVAYTYKNTTFWHTKDSTAKTYTAPTTTYTFTQEEKNKYGFDGNIATASSPATYKEITGYSDGIAEILTQPYDYRPTATKANGFAEDYMFLINHPTDTTSTNTWKKYAKDNNITGMDSAFTQDWYSNMLKAYRNDPTMEKPRYIESGNASAPGISASVYNFMPTVYTKTFEAGKEVVIPYYYTNSTAGYSPIVFVSWELATDTSAASLKATIHSNTTGTPDRVMELDVNDLEHDIELEYNDASVKIALAANDYKASVSYTDAEGNALSSTTIPAPGAGETTVVYATITAEDPDEKRTYKLNITRNADATVYPNYTTTNGSVMIEAEDVVVDEENAKVISASDASGGKYVNLIGYQYTNDPFMSAGQLLPEAPGYMGFNLSFDQPGRYSIWVRYIATTSDSAWIDYGEIQSRTNKKGYSNIDFTEDASGAYHWERIAVMAEQPDATQTIRIRTRESNFKIDKFIITKYFGYEPTGMGELDPDNMSLVAKMPEDVYPMPSIKPTKGEHPRVLFKASDIPTIKENMNAPENAAIVSRFNTLKERTDYTGELLNKNSNYEGIGLEIVLSKAFDYAIFGSEEHGREAISIIKNYANTLQVDSEGDNCRKKGQVLKTIGEVYDWCYPILTSQDKEELMYYAQIMSAGMESGFPPDDDNIFCGHGAEYQIYRDWLTMAIACYDEYPDAYNFVGGKVFSSDSVDYRNWWNQSGTHSQGSSYGPQTRYKAELFAHLLIKRMSGQPLFNEYDLTKIAYEWIYRRRPDGLLMIDGDDNTPNLTLKGDYVNSLNYVTFLASAINGDPILKNEFAKEGGMTTINSDREAVLPIEMLILNDPNVEANVPVSSLPLTTYHSSPVGEMVARTGWNMGVDSNDVVATMTMNEYNPMNHGHYDSGHFMIYYKGILANDSGWYEKHASDHQKTYMSQSIAHNTLIIETPYNKWGNQNQGIDGPEKTDVDTSNEKNFYWVHDSWEEYQAEEENRFAEIMGHEFGPDIQYPEYTYLAGDMKNAYTSQSEEHVDDDVEEAIRHMIFLPTGDEKNPAAFVVFDKIKTKTAGNKKAFMLHMEEKPEVYDNITIIKRTERDYNGKLVNQTLLPALDNLKIDEIGVEYDTDGNILEDKRFWNKNQNWPFLQDMGLAVGADADRTVDPNNSLEAGWGRVEIMPENSSNIDYMLNVMYVGEADDNSAVEEATLIETDSFAGAKIFDRVVMFNKEKARTSEAVSFTVPGDEAALKVNVAGLEAGTWSITVNGNEIGTQVSSNDGGIIYFTAPAGSYTLTYTSEDANKDFENSGAPETIDDELIVGFSYAVDNGDKEYVSFATYDEDKNHSQMFDIKKLPVGTKTVTISDIIKSDSVSEDSYDLKITPSSGVIDVSSGKGIVEICATAPAGSVATDVNKYIIRFIVDAPQVTVTSPVEKGTYTWKYINEPLDQTKHYLYSDLSAWYAGYVGKEIYDSHLFIIPARSASTRKLDKTTVQANYEAKYIQEHPDATEEEIAEAVEENASYLYKFKAPAPGTLYLVSNTEPGLELAGYTKIEGNPANTTEWAKVTTNYTYTQNSFYHVKGQPLKGYKKQGDSAVEIANYSGVSSILTKPYDYIPPATATNSDVENYFVTAYHPADNAAKAAWKTYKEEHYDEFLGSLDSDANNWTDMLAAYKNDPTSEKPKYIESSNAATPGLCANIVCNSVVYKKTFNKGDDVIVPFYYETAPSASTVYNPVVFVSWDALSANVNATALYVDGTDILAEYTEGYTVTLEPNDESVAIELVKKHENATVVYTVDGVAAENGTVELEVGETKTVTATITAEDGTVGDTYTITVIRRPASSDATIASVSYNANGAAATPLAAEDFEEGDVANEYVANVTLSAVTTTVSDFVVATNDSKASVTDNPGTIEFETSEFAKTVTVATITAEDGITVYTYKVNFTFSMWSEDALVSALPYKLIEYVEGDTFSFGDAIMVNRGGSETTSGQDAWYATAVGSKLRGLEYIRGRDISKNSGSGAGSVASTDIKNFVKNLGNTPMLSFKAKKAGTIYAVAGSDISSVYVNGSPVGGKWTALTSAADGHSNGNFTPPFELQDNYDKSIHTDFKTYMQKTYNTTTKKNQFMSNENLWPNSHSVNGKSYGFYAYSAPVVPTPQWPFGFAYKKTFNEGEIVHIPSPGSVTYIPVYFIEWIFSNDASATALYVDDKDILDEYAEGYTVTLEPNDASVEIELVKNDTNATVTYTVGDVALDNGTVTLEVGETKTVKATITAEDGKTKTEYTIIVTRRPASTDAGIASVSYKVDGAAKTLAAADFAVGSAANEYIANVELPIDTTTLSDFVVAANDSKASVTDNPGTITIGAYDFEKTVTVATITAEDAITVYTYKVNFTVPMWSEHEKVSALPYKLIEYVEGDTFSFGDAIMVNRGGSETTSGQDAWYATAVGSNLRGLEYIRGRDISKNSGSGAGSVASADIKNFVANLGQTPMLSFKAKSAGTIYAVAGSDISSVYVNGSPVGGKWTALTRSADGHSNGNFTPPFESQDNYDSSVHTNFKTYMQKTYNTTTLKNKFMSDETLWPNSHSVSGKSYGFYSYSAPVVPTPQWPFGYAYKKEFEAGDIVHIPSPGSVTYIPMYFIKWKLSDDNSAESLTINGEAVKVIEDKAIELAYADKYINVVLEAEHELATVTYTIDDGEPVNEVKNIAAPDFNDTKVVKATITAQNGDCKTYTFTFTRVARTSFAIDVDGNGSYVEYTVSGNTGITYGDYSEEVVLGTLYNLKAVEAEGYEFKYWMNNGKVISEDKELEFTVGWNSAIEAVFRPVNDETVKFVTFKNRNGQIIGEVARLYDGDSQPVPEATQTGYDLVGWLLDGSETILLKEDFKTISFDTPCLVGLANATFTAQYTVSTTEYAVTVTDGYIYLVNGYAAVEKPDNGTYNYNTPIKVKPDEDKGIFSYWLKDNKIASYSPEYVFYVTPANTSLVAKFNDPQKEKPFINISDMVLGDDGKLRVFTERNVPADCTFIGAGLTMGDKSVLGEMYREIDETSTGAGVYQWISKNVDAKQFVSTKKEAAGKAWCVKAWLMYKDADDNIKTVYTTEYFSE